MGANREYKSSVFSLLFSEEHALRELYEALEGVKLPADAPLTINTLEDALYMTLLNDLSFAVADKLVVLIEHQSTINPNMALRLLLYIAEIYAEITAGMDIYGKKPLSVPRPEFFVLYNGAAPYADAETLKLSDLFENAAGLGINTECPPQLELAVKVYNINQGHNEGIAARSKTLKEYSAFIAKAREFGAEKAGGGAQRITDGERDKAIREAMRWCIGNDILKDFLTLHGSEVTNMLMKEWKLDEVLAVWARQSREEGREEGVLQTARNALGRGLPLEVISDITGLDPQAIRSLADQ